MDFGEFCTAFGGWAMDNKMVTQSVYAVNGNGGWIFSAKPLDGGESTYYRTRAGEFEPTIITKDDFMAIKNGGLK